MFERMDFGVIAKPLIWALILAKWACELGLEWVNRRHVLAHAQSLPEAIQGIVDEATYKRSVEYTLAKGGSAGRN